MTECKYISTCAFLKEYESVAPATIDSMKDLYCNSEKHTECKRFIMLEETREEPPAALMPNGRDANTGQIF